MLTIYSEGTRRLVNAAELALEMLARRDELAASSEQDVSTEWMPDQVEVVDEPVSYE